MSNSRLRHRREKTATIVLHPHLEQDDHDAPPSLSGPTAEPSDVLEACRRRKMYYPHPNLTMRWCGSHAERETPGSDANLPAQRHLRQSVSSAGTGA